MTTEATKMSNIIIFSNYNGNFTFDSEHNMWQIDYSIHRMIGSYRYKKAFGEDTQVLKPLGRLIG